MKLRVKTIAVFLALLLFAWAGLVAQTGTTQPTAKKSTPKKMVSNAPHKSVPVKSSTSAKKAMVSNAPKKTTGAPKPIYSGNRSTNSKAPSKASMQAKTKSQTKSNTPASSYGKNRKNARPAQTRYTAQNEPTADRYREIQQALKQKGYLQGDPSGRWDPSSTDALRRFQQDQNLEASGKLDSLSLIALGLGPKRTANAQARP